MFDILIDTVHEHGHSVYVDLRELRLDTLTMM